MKIKILLFFICVGLSIAEFLNKNIVTMETIVPRFISYEKSKTGQLDIYIYGYMSSTHYYTQLLFQIEPEEDELLDKRYSSGNIRYYKPIIDYSYLISVILYMKMQLI